MISDALVTPMPAPTVAGMTTTTAFASDADAVQASELVAATGVDADDVCPADEMPETWCEHPLVMRATTEAGEAGLYAVACGARLAEDCDHCSKKYANRFRRMARANLGLPDNPEKSPAPDGFFLFVTVTHGSCGPVWRAEEVKKCGKELSSWVGAPKDPSRYGYSAQIVRHMVEPALRKSLTQAHRRWADRWKTAGWDVQVVGVREVQERGAGHIHQLIRVHPLAPEQQGPHPGYWVDGKKTKIKPDALVGDGFWCDRLGHVDANPTDDPTRWVVHSDVGTPTAVIWKGTGQAWWHQVLVPTPRTDAEVRASYERTVDVASHRTKISSHLVEYIGSAVHLALREQLGLPAWEKTGLTAGTPEQGQLPAIRDEDGNLEPWVTWGPQVDVRSICGGGDHGAQRILAYLTKTLSYVSKDVGAAEGEPARPGSPRGRHDRRMQGEVLAMAPALIRSVQKRMEEVSGVGAERGFLAAGMPMPVGQSPVPGRFLRLQWRRYYDEHVMAAVPGLLVSHVGQILRYLRSGLWESLRQALRIAEIEGGTKVRGDLAKLRPQQETALSEVCAEGARRLKSALRVVRTALRWGAYQGRAWTVQGRTTTMADVRAVQREFCEFLLYQRKLKPDPEPVTWDMPPMREVWHLLRSDLELNRLPRGRAPIPI